MPTTGHVSKNYPVRTVKDFVKRPQLAIQIIKRIADGEMLAGQLLSSGYSAEGGSVRYMKAQSQYPQEDAMQIAEGSVYPEVHQYDEEDEDKTIKFAGKMVITFEDELRNQLGNTKRGMTRLANSMARVWDRYVIDEVVRQNTDIATQPADAVWRGVATADQILADIFTAVEKVNAKDLDNGNAYTAKSLMMSESSKTALLLQKDIRDIREDASNAAYTGTIGQLAGLKMMVSPYMPDGEVWVVDNGQLGGYADEVPFMMKPIRRDEERDRYILQTKRLSVAFITDPGAMVRITGVA